MGSGPANPEFWTDELLQMNSRINMSYTEQLDTIADLEICCNVSMEELNRIKSEIEKAETKRKYVLELRDSLRHLYENQKNREKRLDELIKVKNCNVELAQEIYELQKQKALEKDKQYKLMEKQLNDVSKESMKIFESNPLVIKRNQQRNQVAKRKFEISVLKQKVSDAEKVYANLNKFQKLIEQQKIIRFAAAMVKYYKKQKEKNEIQLKKQNLNNVNKIQDQKYNLQVITEKAQEKSIVDTPKKLELSSFMNPTNYDFISKSHFETGLKNMSFMKNVENPQLNMQKLQFPKLNISNYQFNPKKYFNANSSLKLETYQPSKQTMSNILNISMPKLTMPEFEYKFQKSTPKKSNQENIPKCQIKQKQNLKRPSGSKETAIKQKNMKKSQDIKLVLNTSTEKEERIFSSQPCSKNASQVEDTFVSLSQDSQMNLSSNSSQFDLQKLTPKNSVEKDISMSQRSQNNNQSSNQNQMFNLQTTKRQTNEEQKQNLTQCNLQTPSCAPMFNISAMTPKKSDEKDISMNQRSQNNNRSSNQNQMFNLQTTKRQTNEEQKQNLTQCNLQTPSRAPMFNISAMTSKKSDEKDISMNQRSQNNNRSSNQNQMFNLQTTKRQTNEEQKQNLTQCNRQTPSLAPMFNVSAMTPKKTEINETHKQTPVENISKSVNLSNPVVAPRTVVTKSPYFGNQTSDEEYVSLNTSAEQSDQMVNVSSNNPASQVSAVDISTEYFDVNQDQPMETEQLMYTEDVPPMDYNNEGYNMMEFYGENPNTMMADMTATQYVSPTFTSPTNCVSPAPNEQILGGNQDNVPAPTNMFGAVQNTGNSFFSFGQSKPSNIFNMF